MGRNNYDWLMAHSGHILRVGVGSRKCNEKPFFLDYGPAFRVKMQGLPYETSRHDVIQVRTITQLSQAVLHRLVEVDKMLYLV